MTERHYWPDSDFIYFLWIFMGTQARLRGYGERSLQVFSAKQLGWVCPPSNVAGVLSIMGLAAQLCKWALPPKNVTKTGRDGRVTPSH
jgi:hypothetical protein|tara:strand:- start:149 stop:412 length:264 start_codon:yes stop_codon:yes gene_type:complete